MKKKVVILFGGNSSEHLISCKSAGSILSNIDKDKYDVIPVVISKDNIWYYYQDEIAKIENWSNAKIEKIDNIVSFLQSIDVVFPIIHGNTGEDGKIQGFFELFDIKYVGSNTLTNSVCLEKEFTKIICSKYNIPVAPYIVVRKNDDIENIALPFSYPVIVKPVDSGSSIGINICKNKEELVKNINYAYKFSNKLLVEKFIKARELECAVLIDNSNLHITKVGEITYNSEFYDYDSKYVNAGNTYIPSTIPSSVEQEIHSYIKTVVKILDIKQISRIDFLYDEVNNKVYLIEVNTLPGFTKTSMYPELLKYDGISYKDLITNLIENA